MFRAGAWFGWTLACVVVTLSCASAQENAPTPPGAPLDLSPPAPQALAARKNEPKPSPKPVAKPVSKPKAKPGPKVKADAPKVSNASAPQASDVTAPLLIPAVKLAATADRPPEKVVVPEPSKAPAPPYDEYVISQFCTSLSSAASDGRMAWQAKRLEEMEARLRERIAELDAKRAETADWLKRREDANRKADETVVAIYAKMKPDAAAAQFSAMDESGAAAILSKLNPRQAGIVLNEIDASRAARIAAEMAGVGQKREVPRSAP